MAFLANPLFGLGLSLLGGILGGKKQRPARMKDPMPGAPISQPVSISQTAAREKARLRMRRARPTIVGGSVNEAQGAGAVTRPTLLGL